MSLFNEEEWRKIRSAAKTGRASGREMEAAVQCAAELLAARGGTMTAHQAELKLGYLTRDAGTLAVVEELRQHIAALGASVAMLRDLVDMRGAEIAALEARLPEGMKGCTILFKECPKGHGRLTATNWIDSGCYACEVDSLRAELARLKPSGQVAEIQALVETIRTALDSHEPCLCGTPDENNCPRCPESTRAERAAKRLAALAQQGQEAKERIAELEGQLEDTAKAWSVASLRAAPAAGAPHSSLPPEAFHESKGLDAEAIPACASGTCGHAQAGQPGHAERIAELSAQWNSLTGAPPVAGDEHTEAAAGGMRVCQSDDDGKATFYNEGYDKGAEDMRAACWEAVRQWVVSEGGHENDKWYRALKAAIDGAAP